MLITWGYFDNESSFSMYVPGIEIKLVSNDVDKSWHRVMTNKLDQSKLQLGN